MLFSSIPFLFYFLPPVLLLYFLTPDRWKNLTLLLSSLVFYGWGEPRFLLFMLGSIFGKVMGESGASVGIAGSLLKLLGDKSVVLVIMITGLVLSYGGIGTFIIAFSGIISSTLPHNLLPSFLY